MIRVRRPFILAGKIPPSKSWLNRALVLRSLIPDIQILEWEPSEFDGKDVAHLEQALRLLGAGGTEFDIGESGTGLRFLAARLSVQHGRFKIRGTKKLLERPHAELFDALAKLGTTIKSLDDQTLELTATGWPLKPISMEIDTSQSSQFASALLLAASVSKHEFDLRTTGEMHSVGYLDMTRSMINAVKAGRRRLVVEADASSVATLATIAVAASFASARQARLRLAAQGIAADENEITQRLQVLEASVSKTLQPDRAVFDHLRLMRSSTGLRAIEADLGATPDLFPCMAALAVFANQPRHGGSTTSKFYGAPHLRLKESDRIRGVARLLKLCGLQYREHADGIEVDGITPGAEEHFAKLRRDGLSFQFDPEQDHRLAFAAAVLAAGGVPIEVADLHGLARGVVSKSFPQFWTMIEGDSPRVALIGHRGTGKTEAARRWAYALGARATMIDLDREVERLAGRSTREVFDDLGETEFRWFERQAWREVDIETRNSVGAVIVACGGGFDPFNIDDSWTRLWLRRSTDKDGRVFFDRPRLDPDLDALTESVDRVKDREPRFSVISDRVFELAEGERDPTENPFLADLFDQAGDDEGSGISNLGGAVTLVRGQSIPETCERLLRWGVSKIEIRDDFWPPSENAAAWQFFETLPADRLILSLRNGAETQALLPLISRWPKSELGQMTVDWALNMGTKMPAELFEAARSGEIGLIVSIHGPGENVLREQLDAIEKRYADIPRLTMKAALETTDFKGLRNFHEWMMESPKTRVFLPMTPKNVVPRWSWYRAWLGPQAPLNFWREGDGSSTDQPTLSQWWRRGRFQSRKFAAVLGDPVRHSRTPIEHDAFFSERRMPIFAIPLRRDEVAMGLPMLIEMGLKAAAVTAPLKEEIVGARAINTLMIVKKGMTTTNTDNVGFQKLWDEAEELRARLKIAPHPLGRGVVVWGGGGVLSSIAHVLPEATFFSASKGKPRESQTVNGETEKLGVLKPEILIWAAGQETGAWPPDWKPRLIIDLSYTENSMARVIAFETGARYISGLTMFKAQASAQREFWLECERET